MARAVQDLPAEFQERMDNIDVVVEEFPSARQLKSTNVPKTDTLLGLYEGVPITERHSSYGLTLPDKITIFQFPIEAICTSDDGIAKEVQKVVIHEIAHHFGISDDRLDELEKDSPL